MSLYLIKHRKLIRMRFIDIKSLHVMYCLPFDRLMVLLWIINEFLKLQQKNGSRGTWVRKFSKTLTNLESSVNVNFCQKFGRQEFGTSCKLHFQVSSNNNNNYKKRVVSSQTADCHSKLKDFESYCRLFKRTMTIWGVIQVIYKKNWTDRADLEAILNRGKR